MNFFEYCKQVAAHVTDPARAERIGAGASSMYQYWDMDLHPTTVAKILNGEEIFIRNEWDEDEG